MKLNMSVEVIRQNIQRRLFISREEYNSLTYGDTLYICRYSQVLDGLVDIYIVISDFYEDEEGNGWICGYVYPEDGDKYYIEKLVSPIIN